MNIRYTNILGVPAHIVDFDDVMRVACDLVLNDSRRNYFVALNAEKIMMARRNLLMRQILEDAYLLYPDGVGVSLGSRILHSKSVPRVPGYDLFISLVEFAAKNDVRIYLLGTKADIIPRTREKLLDIYPQLNLVGHHDGYFSDHSQVVSEINQAAPDILFVGMGSPKQEYWIYDHIDELNVKFCLGVGGAFDVVAGVAKLAPKAIRRLGFEFVYRLIKEPRRLRRQLVFPNFLASLLAERTGLTRRYGK
jgi:N-acetylglucosaminyldiphosphoundecaprenol N-acetyl-beta-D-mannosaminyltransferase